MYARYEALDVTPLLQVRAHPLRMTRFVADAHLGGLARLLRMAGFDTLYDNNFRDSKIAAISAREGRIVLTRDRELLCCYCSTLSPFRLRSSMDAASASSRISRLAATPLIECANSLAALKSPCAQSWRSCAAAPA